MFEKIIFHIDVNSAFLSWEAVYRLTHCGESLDLRETVSAVGGDIAARHGIILAKSIPAGKYGIKTGETILEARRKCPDLMLVPPNYELYEKCSAAFGIGFVFCGSCHCQKAVIYGDSDDRRACGI